MDIPKCRSISSSRSKKGQPRRSARILPIVVVPTQLTPTRLTRNSDSSPPYRRSEGASAAPAISMHRGKADSQDSGGYAEEFARAHAARANPDGLALGDLPRIQQMELDASGHVGDAGLAGLPAGVAGLLALARAGPAGAVADEEGR